MIINIKQRKIKIEPSRIKLNYNIYMYRCMASEMRLRKEMIIMIQLLMPT